MVNDVRSAVQDQIGSWARGSPQPRCYTYMLCSTGVVCAALGVMGMCMASLEVLGLMQPVFSDRFLLWWSVSGMLFGPTGSVGLGLIAIGLLCYMSAHVRLLLNSLTLISLVGAAFFTAMFEASRLVSLGIADDDMMRLWSTADTATICEIQHTLRCSGLDALCTAEGGTPPSGQMTIPTIEKKASPALPEAEAPLPTTPPLPPPPPPEAAAAAEGPAKGGEGGEAVAAGTPPVPPAGEGVVAAAAAGGGGGGGGGGGVVLSAVRRPIFIESWRTLTRQFIEVRNCRDCADYYAARGWMSYPEKTCAPEVKRDAEKIVMPSALSCALTALFLAFICAMCMQPMGLAFAFTTFLLMVMTMAFAAWRRLRDPTANSVQNAQRVVAAAANFLSLILTLVSIAGLHWKDFSPHLKRNITVILFLVPVFAIASSISLLLPYFEEFFATVREIYSTLLLLTLVNIWDTTAETKAVISLSSDYDSNVAKAEQIRDTHRARVRALTVVKIVLIDTNLYLFGAFYPRWAKVTLVTLGVLIFSFVLTVIHEIYTHLPTLAATGTHQFFSVKAIVSFIFFEFAVLKVLNFEGLQSVVMGELYISVALVGLAAFQLYTWIIAPLGHDVSFATSPESESVRLGSARRARTYGTAASSRNAG